MKKPMQVVHPIVEVKIVLFLNGIIRLPRAPRKPIRTMKSPLYMHEVEVESQNRKNPPIYASRRLYIRVCQHSLYIPRICLHNQFPNTYYPQPCCPQTPIQSVNFQLCLGKPRLSLIQGNCPKPIVIPVLDIFWATLAKEI